MRRSSVRNVSRNARSTSAPEPGVFPGSRRPQCAVTGGPGHTGQASCAALSHRVNTKFITAAPGFANSSQLLLRSPLIDNPAASSCLNAYGFRYPAGWLPALNTKFITAAPGFANSSQLLLRSPLIDNPAASSCLNAYGFRYPAGWLPALN